MRRTGPGLLLAAMRENVPLECGSGAMESPVNVDERVGASAVPAAPVVTLGGVGTFALALRFLVKFLQAGAHPRQFLTPHARSIA